MTKLELGDKVKCTRKYVRTKEGLHRKWEAKIMQPTEGIVIGKRTISDGFINYEGVYRVVHYKTAYLVAFNMHRNPVLIPEGFVFLAEPDIENRLKELADLAEGYNTLYHKSMQVLKVRKELSK